MCALLEMFSNQNAKTQLDLNCGYAYMLISGNLCSDLIKRTLGKCRAWIHIIAQCVDTDIETPLLSVIKKNTEIKRDCFILTNCVP